MIKRLQVHKFRSHSFCSVPFTKGMFAIVGPNGIGKTNLLEAITVATLGRSFRTDSFKEMLKEGEEDAQIILGFEEDGVDHEIGYRFGANGKQIRLNETYHKSFSPLLGHIPVGIVSPKDVVLIEGSPSFRRKYLNQILCQSSKEYAFHWKRYMDALEQKNAALKANAIKALYPYEEILTSSAHVIQKMRSELLEELNSFLNNETSLLLQKNESIRLQYEPSFIEDSPSTRLKEIERRTTLKGPHREDFAILFKEKEASCHASEGQKRALVLALRFAELTALEKKTHKAPLLLIDDFGAHLDKLRFDQLLERTLELPQSILTVPHSPTKASSIFSLEEFLVLSH
ncbi:MAG: DNA replication and repair protein RecF [Chlamydiae bacterium]|nr:DNA replication and repair protein RecF [Chlamydiota bacterium]